MRIRRMTHPCVILGNALLDLTTSNGILTLTLQNKHNFDLDFAEQTKYTERAIKNVTHSRVYIWGVAKELYTYVHYLVLAGKENLKPAYMCSVRMKRPGLPCEEDNGCFQLFTCVPQARSCRCGSYSLVYKITYLCARHDHADAAPSLALAGPHS
jgi:hypothetical protein